MKAEDKSFFFLTTPSYYDIPFFQRAYVWNETNWSDLLANLTSRNQNHFLGSIILKNELASAGHLSRYSVIDGQQRLTTLSVLLRACYDHIEKQAANYGLDADTLKKCQVQMESLLFVSEGGIKQTLHVKINHSHLDKPAFEKVINGELAMDDKWEKFVNLPDDDNTSGIIKAYAFFRDALEDYPQDTIDYLWELLTVDKIKFLVNIDLDVTDNEQAIFDTVNSAGVRLSSADTIKNLLYQRYVEILRASNYSNVDEEAVSKYESTWVDAFIADDATNAYWETQRQYGRMKRSNIETFLHAFAVVEGFFNPAENNMSELPNEYRAKVSEMKEAELSAFLDEMHDYAGVFREYFSDGEEFLSFDNYIGRVFNICNVLEVSTFYPYLLQQLYAWKKGKISDDDIKGRFFAIEKYVVINAICKGSNKNYNNECKQLVDNRRTPTDLFDSCIYISENNFVDGLRRMTTNKLPTLLLFWVELFIRNSENFDIKSLKYGYTLEHIMPQKWMQNWNDVTSYDTEGNEIEDSDEIERARSHAIYEIGNMTLLNSKLNTSISNSAFYDKVHGKHGRKGIKDLADLFLTKEIFKDNNASWDERNIYARTQKIEYLVRDIWDAKDLPVENVTSAKMVEGGRYALRLKFWEKALPVIREKNNNEAYNNVNPTTSNESSGYFGIGGFKMICVANYDNARVDFYLGKSEQEKNKKAFDILISHKDEIEEKLGTKLIWDRANDYKASWISYLLNGVSITNEADWDKMAAFLGEWSYKLRTTLVPYLQDQFPQDDTPKRPQEEIDRLIKIAEILKEWTISSPQVIEYPEKCNRTYTRFMTETMSKILPDLKDAPSGWNTDNHYFYEIVNRNGKDVDIKLSFSSRNMSEEQLNKCRTISELVDTKPAKDDWQWWVVFKTAKVTIPEDLNKDAIFAGLDTVLKSVFEFENKLFDELVKS